MTRILTVIIFILSVFCAHAATVCTRNDKVVIGLSSQQVPTLVAYDDEAFEWSVYYDGVGVVRGVSSCSPLRHYLSGVTGPWNGNGFGALYTSGPVLASANFQGRSDGGHCWCKITHPFESEWAYMHLYNASCVANCAAYCSAGGNGLSGTGAYAGNVRKALFFSVAMADE